MAPSRRGPRPVRQLLGAATGLLLAIALSMPFTGCSRATTESAFVGARDHTFAQSLSNHPELARLAQAFDQAVATPTDPQQRRRQFNLFSDVFELTRSDYVDRVTSDDLVTTAVDGITKAAANTVNLEARAPANLMAAALSAMLSGLDAHSDYLTPDDYEEIRVRTRGEFGGIGIEVTMENGLVKCVSPIDDTPAARAGILAGDMITHVDGESVLGKTLMQAVERMRGRVGTDIIVTVLREGVAVPFDVAITRDIIRIRSVRARSEGNIGYLRVTTFNERTTTGLRDGVKRLRAELGDRMAGFVLDLRNNPGGLLDQALAVSDAFLTGGEIVSTAGRRHRDIRRFSADRSDIADGLPIVALINGGSASASEIVSGALQDHGRAIILGSRSFGKGSVQTIMPVKGGGAVRLTTARYYTPSGRSIQVTGIVPDIRAEDGDAANREGDLDNVLEAEGTMETVSTDTLETACPTATSAEDPVLACALQLLRGQARSAAAAPVN
ncbi:MAG: S41 family peptidase [Alphaproteobacteria bacterium]|nr:S41 family peptidase [Alphaproteobacteria bacterium]